MNSTRQEMKNFRLAFEQYNRNPDELVGYQIITIHLIYDIKYQKTSDAKHDWLQMGIK